MAAMPNVFSTTRGGWERPVMASFVMVSDPTEARPDKDRRRRRASAGLAVSSRLAERGRMTAPKEY